MNFCDFITYLLYKTKISLIVLVLDKNTKQYYTNLSISFIKQILIKFNKQKLSKLFCQMISFL